MNRDTSITAKEAAALLGVSRATLYAYVSRGYIRSKPSLGDPRGRRYVREDVERMLSRNEGRRDPGKTAERALHWGMPILESSITLIAEGTLYYRGHDVATLARTRTLEEVSSLIWTGSFDADIFGTPLHVVAGGRSVENLPFVNRAEAMLALVAARDPLAFDFRARSVAQTGWRIMNLLTSVAAESSALEPTIDETLRLHWAPKSAHATDIIRAALILCVDHELNVSSFTARCVASAGSNPYSVVIGGLAAIEGVRHGGATTRVETLLEELRRSRDLDRALADRLRRADPIPGFGHRLYRNGDPRAAVLLSMLEERFPKSKEIAFARQLAEAAEALLDERPTIDFALAAAARVLRLPPGAPLILFALGRTIGWIGHAIEQYDLAEMIRPRARYTGEVPTGRK